MFPTDAREQSTLAEPRGFTSDDPIDRMARFQPEGDELDFDGDELDSPQSMALHKVLAGYYEQELYIQHKAREEMRRDEAYYDGDQWDETDAATLRARGQVPLVYNVIAPAVNWLLGTERRSRTQYKVLPRSKTGSKAAERKSQLMKYLADQNRSAHHMSKAFQDAVKAGLGWLECGYAGADEHEPVYTRSESWRSMLYDSRAIEDDLEDARYIFRAKWTDVDIAKSIFKDRANVIDAATVETADLGGLYLDGEGDEAMDEREMATSDYQPILGTSANVRGRVRLIECWYKRPVDEVFLKGGEFSGEVFDPWSMGHITSISSGMATTITRTKMRVHLAIFTSAGLLYNDVSPYRHNKYPFTPVWGNRRGKDGLPYGLIRNLRDIQQDINKRASKALHILNTSKVIMDKDAVEDKDELAEEVARPDAIIEKKKGYELRIDADRDIAAAHMDVMSRDIEMVQQQSGITDEAMGRTTNATSGKAIIARQNQGSVATSHFLDNFTFSRKVHGEKELSLIEQYYSDEKEFRIVNKRGAPEYVTINDSLPENDIARTKADFIIDEEAWSATKRQAQFEELSNFTAKYAGNLPPQIGLTVFQLLIEASDLPNKDDIVGQLRTFTEFNPDADPDEELTEEEIARKQAKALEAQMQARAAEAEIATKEATAAEKFARADKITADKERTEAQAISDRLAALEKAVQTALAMMQARPVAAVADQLLSDAEAAVQPPAPPMPPADPAMAGQPQPPMMQEGIPPNAV